MLKFIKSFFAKCIGFLLGTTLVILAIPINSHSELSGRIIILDPGHGIGMNMYKGYDEGVRMLDFANILKPKLEKLGATVHLTRSTLEDVSLVNRVSNANILSLEVAKASYYAKLRVAPDEYKSEIYAEIDEINRLIVVMNNIIDDEELGFTYYRLPYSSSADRVIHDDLLKIFEYQNSPDIESRMLYLSLHTNATPLPIDESLNGVTVYYTENNLDYNSTYFNDYSYTENNRFLASSIIDGVSEQGFSRLPIEMNNFFVTREMNIPSILSENGYHTNDFDRENLLSDKTLNNMADAYCDAIIEYYSMDFIPEIPVYDVDFFTAIKDLF